MASRKCTIDTFPAEIQKILQKYGEEVNQNLSQVVDETAQKAAQTLRSSSPVDSRSKKSGAYAKGWRVEKSGAKGGRGVTVGATVYNTHPGLTHLLENGHALRQGGRASARVHIAPVNDAILTELEMRLARL